MRTKLVKRHYCDHCGKGGMVANLIRQHEATCIRNPSRGCFLCGENNTSLPPVAERIEAFRRGGLSELRNEADGCPACILAAIVQSLPKRPDAEDYVQFNYKEEKDEWYANQRINFQA